MRIRKRPNRVGKVLLVLDRENYRSYTGEKRYLLLYLYLCRDMKKRCFKKRYTFSQKLA